MNAVVRLQRQSFQRQTMAVKSTFRIVDLLAITGGVATYLALRACTVKYANESFVMFSPYVVATILATYGAVRTLRYAWIYGVALSSAFATSTAWAIEKVYRLPGTSFLHNDWVYNNYGDDPMINGVAVIGASCIATALCGTLASLFRFLAHHNPEG